jgi:hypothetical protein
MSFQSQVLKFWTSDEPLRRYTLDTSVIKCYGDVAMGRGHVLHDTGLVKETIIFLCARTETMAQCGQLWQSVARQQNHTCLLNTINLSNVKWFSKVFFFATLHQCKCSNWCPSCCWHMWIRRRNLERTRRNVRGVMAAHSARILSWSSAMLRGRLPYTTDLKWSQRNKSNGVRSGERGGHSTGPLRPIHRLGNHLFNHWRATMRKCGGASSCWK